MKLQTPPLHLLLTVEAAVRLRSFKAAASELHITPSAVSHRIRILEQKVGRPLFARTGQQIVPSQDAVRLAARVGEATQGIAQVWEEVQSQAAQRSIRISCMPAFATRYVLADFQTFLSRYPNVKLDLTSSRNQLMELERGGFDIAVHYGTAPTVGFLAELLKSSSMLPIVAKAARARVVRGQQLLGPLLDFSNDTYSWDSFVSAIGYELVPATETIRCESVMSACAAAEAGVGVALLPDWVAQEAIARGSVEALTPHPIQTTHSYWLVTRRGEEDLVHHVMFKNWLKSQITRIDAPVPPPRQADPPLAPPAPPR